MDAGRCRATVPTVTLAGIKVMLERSESPVTAHKGHKGPASWPHSQASEPALLWEVQSWLICWPPTPVQGVPGRVRGGTTGRHRQQADMQRSALYLGQWGSHPTWPPQESREWEGPLHHSVLPGHPGMAGRSLETRTPGPMDTDLARLWVGPGLSVLFSSSFPVK